MKAGEGERKRAITMVLVFCALLGAVAAAFVMAAAWGHNPRMKHRS